MTPMRFSPLTDEQMDGPQRSLMARIRQFSIAPASGPFPMLLRNPAVGERFLALSHYLRFETQIPDTLSELAILLHARVGCDAYEWGMHVPRGLAAGLDASVIDDLQAGRMPRQLDAPQRAIYRFCVQLLQHKQVDDAAFNDAVAVLGEGGVVDLTVMFGLYDMLSRVLAVAEVDRQGAAPLEPLQQSLPA